MIARANRPERNSPASRGPAIRVSVSESDVLAFLKNPTSYPHHPERVKIIQTHASWVAIADEFVYKVKKPINLGFLDFSTLEKRHHFCLEELRLNRRLCPNIYENVVPISLNDGKLVMHNDDNIVEYALKMKTLSDGQFLDQMLSREDVGEKHLDRVAEKLVKFYNDETPSAEMAAWGRIEKLRISTDENFAQTECFVSDLISSAAFETIRWYTDHFYNQHARLLNGRRAGGHILDCHGDLHLEHIHLSRDSVCIYDCIEFNERLRYVDTASDLAFLAMDLDFNGRPGLARYFLQRMATVLRDPDLLLLADFYKCYRAYVRAKVESIKSVEQDVPEDEKAVSRDRAERYYQLALRYAVAGSGPLVIVVMGRVGTGKSTLANLLARSLGWDVLSSDRLRKEHEGVALYERGNISQRAELYSRDKTSTTYSILCDEACKRGRLQQGVVLDATYGNRQYRDELRVALRNERISCYFLEVKASPEIVRDRLLQRETMSKIISDARLEDFDSLNERYEEPDNLEDENHFTVESGSEKQRTLLDTLHHMARLSIT